MDLSADGIHQHHEFEQVCRLCATMDQLACSKLLRLEAFRVAVERHTEDLKETDADANVDSVEAKHHCIQYSGLISKEVLLDREIHESLTVFKQHDFH